MTILKTSDKIQVTINMPEKYLRLIGAHTTLYNKFVVIKGKVIKDTNGKLYFANGEQEELWKCIPYRLLHEGDWLGICISSNNVNLVVKGKIKKKEIKTEKQSKTSWIWEGPMGEVNVNSLLDRIAPFLSENNEVEIVIWK